jgi:hypothetical protein
MNWRDIVILAAAVLSPALLLALSWTGARLTHLIGALARKERATGALLRLDQTVFAVVREIQQVTADPLRAAAPDGKLGTNVPSMLHRAAISRVRQHLGTRGVSELARVLGLDGDALDRLLATRVEAAVYELKRPHELASTARRGVQRAG